MLGKPGSVSFVGSVGNDKNAEILRQCVAADHVNAHYHTGLLVVVRFVPHISALRRRQRDRNLRRVGEQQGTIVNHQSQRGQQLQA